MKNRERLENAKRNKKYNEDALKDGGLDPEIKKSHEGSILRLDEIIKELGPIVRKGKIKKLL